MTLTNEDRIRQAEALANTIAANVAEDLAVYGPLIAAMASATLFRHFTLNMAVSPEAAREGFAAFMRDNEKLTDDDWSAAKQGLRR